MTRRFAVLLLALAGATALAPDGLAHAFLDRAIPPVGASVVAAPAEIRLFFSEAIEPLFSRIELSFADGRPATTARAAVDPADAKQFVLKVPPLPPGRYRVRWHVVSVDTHPTEGDYIFEIGR